MAKRGQHIPVDSETTIMSTTKETFHANGGLPSQDARLSRKSRQQRSTIARMCMWIVDHQIGIAATLISSVLLVHNTFPAAREHTNKFLHISYLNPRTNNYAIGWDDAYFVAFWVTVFTGLRCAVMEYFLAPIAAWLGLRKRKEKTRFVEQAWIFMYDTTSWSLGMSIVYNSYYWMDIQAMWLKWPIREIGGFNKWYYLVQFAFWIQQIVVLNIEERRKDHWQMFTHHVVTCTLMFTSYGYHFTDVGTVILVLMDVVDLFLPLAKILKYLKFQMACDIAFGVFMLVWVVARHLLYMRVWLNAYITGDDSIKKGCYVGSAETLRGPLPLPDGWSHVLEPFYNPTGRICYSSNVRHTFLTLLAALQVILLIWFCMIMRVAYKVISGQGADDVRSDDEEEEEEEEELHTEKHHEVKRSRFDQVKLCMEPRAFIEREIDSTEMNFVTASNATHISPAKSPVRRSSRRKVDSSSTGVNILGGSSDRKELLGRIGCDKQSEE